MDASETRRIFFFISWFFFLLGLGGLLAVASSNGFTPAVVLMMIGILTFSIAGLISLRKMVEVDARSVMLESSTTIASVFMNRGHVWRKDLYPLMLMRWGEVQEVMIKRSNYTVHLKVQCRSLDRLLTFIRACNFDRAAIAPCDWLRKYAIGKLDKLLEEKSTEIKNQFLFEDPINQNTKNLFSKFIENNLRQELAEVGISISQVICAD
ncbi:MAG: hypothetical protein WCT08_05205 [Patescibacteria group bacterium]|jgi:hypothetical protein